MARGDITAGEVFQDREMLERLGYGIFDLTWTQGGVGFENVKDFSYVVANDADPKIYRRKVYEMLGRYYDNDLAKALWNKFIDHKWVLSERAGREIDLQTAAEDWFEKYSHAFLKEWTFRQTEVPERIRFRREPSKGLFGVVTSMLLPNLTELLNNGFTVTDILKAVAIAKKPLSTEPGRLLGGKKKGRGWRLRTLKHCPAHGAKEGGKKEKVSELDDRPYLVVKKIDHDQRDIFYIRLVAELTGHRIQTAEEAEKRWREILEHKWYMSEREGHDVGLRPAALDYYRRLNLIQEMERASPEAE